MNCEDIQELLKQAREEFRDLHQVHDGERRHTQAQESEAAQKIAGQYLAGGFKVLQAGGEALMAAVLAAVGRQEFQIFNRRFFQVIADEMALGNEEIVLYPWLVMKENIRLGPRAETVVNSALNASQEEFLICSVLMASQLLEKPNKKEVDRG